MFYIEKPYFGAAYYPESWPAEQVEADIRLMKEAGVHTVRIAEFAWSTMEPAEGSYNFTFFHHVVDCLREAGIAVIMGTPTCMPPAWLSEKYPEILIVDASGKRMSHGARRHACPNNEVLTERQVRKPQYLCGFRDFPNRINLPLYTKFTPIGAKNGAETKKSHNLRNEWAVP